MLTGRAGREDRWHIWKWQFQFFHRQHCHAPHERKLVRLNGSNLSFSCGVHCSFFLKMAHSRPFFFIFVRLFYKQLTGNIGSKKSCRWLDSNCGPLVSEATTLPTEPQPLPKCPNVLTMVATSSNSKLSRPGPKTSQRLVHCSSLIILPSVTR